MIHTEIRELAVRNAGQVLADCASGIRRDDELYAARWMARLIGAAFALGRQATSHGLTDAEYACFVDCWFERVAYGLMDHGVIPGDRETAGVPA